MFKKGQLVQSLKYGDYYVVDHIYSGGYLWAQPLQNSRRDDFFSPMNRLRLIGNNYRPKARK